MSQDSVLYSTLTLMFMFYIKWQMKKCAYSISKWQKLDGTSNTAEEEMKHKAILIGLRIRIKITNLTKTNMKYVI